MNFRHFFLLSTTLRWILKSRKYIIDCLYRKKASDLIVYRQGNKHARGRGHQGSPLCLAEGSRCSPGTSIHRNLTQIFILHLLGDTRPRNTSWNKRCHHSRAFEQVVQMPITSPTWLPTTPSTSLRMSPTKRKWFAKVHLALARIY